MHLTDHFSLAELTQSQTAARCGIDNTPPPEIIKNLTRIAQVLEQIRSLLGARPIVVTSGYRAPALNQAVGGALSSAHVQGLAVDFICPSFGTPLAICKRLAEAGLEFDQLIHEGTWVHIGLAPLSQRPRRQILTAHFGHSPARYSTGL
ncbi:peptidase M15 [Burkholderia ubonensis]|uniref:D-Ala-D-Ala carboxypeptidase family metallohydrolase n=1 Tax=Burkholderia ubonensis TaxID=101571 RepID=UPI00075F2351|nr:D-Ala-D-Ala carboxypeptidase family metallohydrolase [Burkholderia ubonensis]KWI31905.1 peptidase M15 [Burkholderia ubonensis]OJB11834.1 peptidase M15 [Burkholderia ubonensis]